DEGDSEDGGDVFGSLTGLFGSLIGGSSDNGSSNEGSSNNGSVSDSEAGGSSGSDEGNGGGTEPPEATSSLEGNELLALRPPAAAGPQCRGCLQPAAGGHRLPQGQRLHGAG